MARIHAPQIEDRKMNKDNILRLADIIEAQPHTSVDEAQGFNMEGYIHHCGTPSCIAGFAAFESLKETTNDEEKIIKTLRLLERYNVNELWNLAIKWLGFSEEVEIYELFHPRCSYQWHNITPQEAAKVLRHFAETGEIDWTLSNYARGV